MAVDILKSYPRLWTLEEGTAMVVTDLHGDWDAYERYRDRFASLHDSGQADYLIFTGDLIHAENPKKDKSLEIISDILALRLTYGEAIIVLCGNHELPHIYSITLAKGDRHFTPDFEKALSQSEWREEITSLFHALPFYIRTRAGVSLTHAGAPAIVAEPDRAIALFNWRHRRLLDWAMQIMSQEDIPTLRQGYSRLNQDLPYDMLAKYFLAVSGPDDPRYDDLLRGFIATSHPDFEALLWPALFTRCEQEYGLADHRIFVDALLQALSTEFSAQNFLVTGHITIKGGHETVTKQHLRLASAHHATPRRAGQYLLFDTSSPVDSITTLVNQLGTVF
ncbi:MAG TPA: metallophosphoesterase family protein [Anaerolineae bacterium]|nr:metallophosphoesterase family protein [Anaerolineae bacterium]